MNQSLHIQLQQYKRQKMEVSSALEHLQGSDESYQILGQIMVKKDSQDLIARLQKQQSSLDEQIKILQQQINESS